MKALLLREPSRDFGTFGTFIIGPWWCHCLELPDRNNQTNVSRVNAGTYELIVVTTRHFIAGRNRLYLLQNVAGRSGILVHGGNVAGDKAKNLRSDSLGCILLGYGRGVVYKQPGIIHSRQALRDFHRLTNNQPVTLTIEDYTHVGVN